MKISKKKPSGKQSNQTKTFKKLKKGKKLTGRHNGVPKTSAKINQSENCDSNKNTRESDDSIENMSSNLNTSVSTRYILFVGNLPYGTSEDQVRTFFNNKDIVRVSLLTDKKTGKPKGCAFVEFSSVKSYTTGLAYHRQLFDGRTIRVQKTVGGGGNGQSRMEKLKKKNNRLAKTRSAAWKTRKSGDEKEIE